MGWWDINQQYCLRKYFWSVCSSDRVTAVPLKKINIDDLPILIRSKESSSIWNVNVNLNFPTSLVIVPRCLSWRLYSYLTLQNMSLRSSFGLIHDATASQKNIKSCNKQEIHLRLLFVKHSKTYLSRQNPTSKKFFLKNQVW